MTENVKLHGISILWWEVDLVSLGVPGFSFFFKSVRELMLSPKKAEAEKGQQNQVNAGGRTYS